MLVTSSSGPLRASRDFDTVSLRTKDHQLLTESLQHEKESAKETKRRNEPKGNREHESTKENVKTILIILSNVLGEISEDDARINQERNATEKLKFKEELLEIKL